ncbi:MAG: N4-gp56 family major capsid protein [Oscillospiraceae bacterium]|nr:N4-gp56 family major capsid protein [Oscillospiraceae bacterium]
MNLTVNTTTGDVNAFDASALHSTGAMSTAMKTYYDTELLENARPRLIFTQLGKSQFLPAGHGDSVQWRKWNTFDKSLTPLTEGVIPSGQKFGQSAISVSVQQYGDYAAISDRLNLHAVDNVLLGAAEEMGAAGGETADTLVRNEVCTGTSVLYADTLDSSGAITGTPSYRYQLSADNNRLTPDVVNKAYTFLKKQKAPFFEGNKYVAVIHPSAAYDLRSHPDWMEAHKYAAAHEIFEGEIGELHGVRFVESTEAPVFNGGNLFSSSQSYLSYAAFANNDTTSSATYGVPTANKLTVSETLTADHAALVGRKIHIYDNSATAIVGTWTITGVTPASKYIWVDADVPSGFSFASGDKFYPGEGGNSVSGSCAVYGTLFFGKDAFGVVDPEGMSMEMIIKDASQIGGPLNQFSTVGYKFETAAKILYQNRMVRVESCSAYSTVDEGN